MSHTIKDIYKYYKATSNVPVKTEAEFRSIWAEYMDTVIEEVVLEGEFIHLAGRMGDFKVVRKRRNTNAPTPNWGLTNKAKKDGTYTGIIFYTDEFYYRYLWRKSNCIVKNKSIWNFKPTRGDKGLKTKLTSKLASDELAYLNFKQHGNL